MREVVSAELHFVTILRELQISDSHSASIVDKDVDSAVRLLKYS